MQQVVVEERGGAEVLRTAHAPSPEVQADQVLVRIEYAGVNYADVMQREGRYPAVLPLPYVPGHEVVGVIESVGDNVDGLREGERIAAIVPQGGYAQYASVDAREALPVPSSVDAAQAAALLVQGMTAFLLVEQLVREGDDVLVTAAAGGVGALVVQLALASGARAVVGAVGCAEKRAHVHACGAHSAAYDRDGWEVAARDAGRSAGFQVVIDAVGGAVREASYRVLSPFGRMGIYGNSSQREEHWNAERWHGLLMANQSVHGYAITHWIAAHAEFARRAFRALTTATTNGTLIPRVHPAYALEDAARAHADLEARRTTGKVVLRA